MKLTREQIDTAIRDGIDALDAAPTKNRANVYPDGFVANAYGWPAPAERVVVRRTPDGYVHTIEQYDRKRSHGAGGYITLWRS